MPLFKASLISFGAGGLRHQTNLLIVTDGLYPAARPLGQAADGEFFSVMILDPSLEPTVTLGRIFHY